MSNVIIALAHHLDAASAERLGLPSEDLTPGTEIVVPQDVAQGLIGAGYAAVETEDVKAVSKALRRKAPAEAKVGLFVAPEDGEGAKADDGKTIAQESPGAVSAPVEGAAPRRAGKSDKD